MRATFALAAVAAVSMSGVAFAAQKLAPKDIQTDSRRKTFTRRRPPAPSSK